MVAKVMRAHPAVGGPCVIAACSCACLHPLLSKQFEQAQFELANFNNPCLSVAWMHFTYTCCCIYNGTQYTLNNPALFSAWSRSRKRRRDSSTCFLLCCGTHPLTVRCPKESPRANQKDLLLPPPKLKSGAHLPLLLPQKPQLLLSPSTVSLGAFSL